MSHPLLLVDNHIFIDADFNVLCHGIQGELMLGGYSGGGESGPER
ncbi:hypothetical protein [uncultured Shewanella sp.]|nr:hypothetical protein [uncultured Shewanella sp.]